MFLVSFFHIYSLMAHQHLTTSGFESYQVNFHSYLTTNTVWVRAPVCKLQKGCTRLAVASDKVYYTSCLPMVGGSLRVLQLLPPVKLVTII